MGKVKIRFEILNDQTFYNLSDRTWRRHIELYLITECLERKGYLIRKDLDSAARLLRTTSEDLLSALRELEKAGFVIAHKNEWQFQKLNHWQSPASSIVGNDIAEAVYARDHQRCRYCGAIAEQIDHVVPRAQGGSDDMRNFVACCAFCNQSKGARTPEEAEMELRPI